MNLWRGLKYTIYGVCLMLIALGLEQIMTKARIEASQTNDLTLLIILGYALSLVLGLLLGGEGLVKEFSRPGRWRINKEKLVFMVLPAFLVAIAVMVFYIGFIGVPKEWDDSFQTRYLSFSSIFYQFLGVLTGFSFFSCIRKQTVEQADEAIEPAEGLETDTGGEAEAPPEETVEPIN